MRSMRAVASCHGVLACVLGCVAAGWLLAPPVQAHHAFAAEFDVDRGVRVEGEMVRLELTNPHGWIYLDVKNPEGKVERWKFETGAGGSLARRGFNKNSVKPGTDIVIVGFLAKGMPRMASAAAVIYPDGRQVMVGSADR